MSFMGRIVQLSKNVINQIAAGEVIERPYSVVKELVENSVDAGATKISVEIANDCRDIRVADNGSGIHPDDIMLAFSKHATSKIETGEDLYNIKTMGFRGEALASIISISKLTCITRTVDFDYGTKVECQNSEVKQSQTGCAVGTIMTIKDLFYNLPARLKFLKSAKTELSYITEFMQAIAIVHPEISFELKFNGKVTFKTTAQNEQIQTIKEIFSAEVTNNLKEVLKTDKLSNLKIRGFVSSPDYTRASKKDYYLYVNSRLVKCPVFQKSVDMVYKNLIGNSRYPFIVLNLEIPTEDVDVNVTFPENYQAENLKGKAVVFKCHIHKVSIKKAAELDDSFASKFGLTNVEELRNALKDQLFVQKTNKELNDYITKVWDKIAEDSDIEVTDDDIKGKMDEMVEYYGNAMAQYGATLDQYLEMAKLTMDAFKEQLKPEAVKSTKIDAIYNEIVKKENIEITDEDVDNEFKQMQAYYNIPDEEMEGVRKESMDQDSDRCNSGKRCVLPIQ